VTPISRTSTRTVTHHGQLVEQGQPDQRAADERLVRDRVGELAERGDQAAAAGDLAVQRSVSAAHRKTPAAPSR
jgi:hypothetical protein